MARGAAWCLGLLALAQLLAFAAATPSMWVSAHLNIQSSTGTTNPPGLTCISQPEVQYGGHPGPNWADSTWLAKSRAMSFTLTNSANVATTTVAVGSYSLVVNFGGPSGHMFLTTTNGDLSATSYALSACGLGSRIATTSAATSWTQTLAFGCPQLINQTSVSVRATYATGQGQIFVTNNITLAVDKASVNASCWNYVPPSPAPSPSPAIVTPTNTTKPVYPLCIGAALLPNPIPLGKSCVYDTQCQVQCQDLVYPNCDNAQPLPNPPAAGKCCFYDAQCKPQCEDKTNKPSRCPVLPACTVPNCAECSANSSAVCVKCWQPAMLNVTSAQCDCMPGYYYAASVCKKCSNTTISYGGRPTACTACPAGRVPNKDQSECVAANAFDHWGYDITNRRWAYAESTLNYSNAGALTPRWTFAAGSDVTATPTIVNGRVYVPDWNGNLFCLDAATGATVWQRRIIDLVLAVDPAPYPAGYTNTSIISRTSPAISGNTMVIGVMKKGGGFPYVFALDISNIAGPTILWWRRADPHPAAMVTQSPTIHNGFVYIGVSSLEELWATSSTYPCCSFRGSMMKLNLATGALVWRTYTAPDNGGAVGGFSGNSVWGSSPAVDVLRNQVYIATGNNYEIPDNLTACLTALGPLTPANAAAAAACEFKYGPTNYHNSMLALDLTTGAVRWVRQLGGPDAWTGACMQSGNPNCKTMDLNSPDYDYAQAPMLVTACNKGMFCKQLVVAGQKSGWLWALAPDTGAIHWGLPVGPGGTVGGLQWGSAADNTRIYVSNNNYLNVSFALSKPVVNFPATTNQLPPTSTDGGIAAAVNAYDGSIAWMFSNPTDHWSDVGAAVVRKARSQAPMTVANDVVFYPSMDMDGTLFYLDARTGRLIGSFKTGMTTGCGPSVVNGKVFIGSGYNNFGLGLTGNKLHMLSL